MITPLEQQIADARKKIEEAQAAVQAITSDDIRGEDIAVRAYVVNKLEVSAIKMSTWRTRVMTRK